MDKRFRWLLLALWSTSVSAAEITPYIVNGTDANIVNYPSFASLYYRNGNVYGSAPYCGATMINSEYALTAAHCIYGDNEQMLYTVVVPQHEEKSTFLSSEQIKAVEFYYPDNYVNSSRVLWPNDIAILKLESSASVPDYSSLLNQAINNTFSQAEDYIAVGHGFTNGGVPSGSSLQQTVLGYVDLSSCRAEYGSSVTSSHLCFSGALNSGYRNSTCGGDSGGPVYWFNGVQYIQIGITSFGPENCGDPSVAVTSVFTDIYDYQGWISRVINGSEQPKAYITEIDGVRTLVNNDSGDSFAGVSAGTRGSSGSLSLLSMLFVVIISISRIRASELKRLLKKEHSYF